MTTKVLRSEGMPNRFRSAKSLFIVAFAMLALWNTSHAQNAGVGISDNVNFTPNPKAILDLGPGAVPKGLLAPRMTEAQRNALCTGTPDPDCVSAPGLLVYQTNGTPGYYLWTGTAWTRLLDDNFSLDEVDPTWNGTANETSAIRREGNVGIGITTGPTEKLTVNGKIRFTNDDHREIYVATPVATGTAGRDLTLRAGNVLGSGSGSSIGFGGDLILQAGSGNVVAAGVGPHGGDVRIRSGSNNSVGINNGGEIVLEIGSASGSFSEALRVDRLGRVTINNLIHATNTRLITASPAGQLGGLTLGAAGEVLKVNTGATGIEWGPSVASSLSIPAIDAGEVLYYNGSTWVPLAVPGAASDAAASWALTLPNAGQGAPQWIESTSLIVSGDDLGDHTATEDIKLNGYNITGTGNITIVGRVNSNGILETSDGRFKKDVEVISDALSTVQNLRGVTYDWKAEEFPDRGFNAQREMGVIAQEVELLVPEVVNTDENGFKSVQYGHLVPLLIEAIKEQQKIIDGQQVELTSLKAMQDEMETLKASIELLSEHIKTAAK